MMEILGALFFVGIALALWQAFMHRNRTVLVREDGLIQVFRKRRLDMVVAAQDIRLEKADIIVMVKIGAPLAIAATLFLAVGITMLWRERTIDSGTLSVLALGVASGVSLASAAWTTFFRRHLRVPVRNSRWLAEETVLLSAGQFKILFPGEDRRRPLR
jgi:drug/metabolite transporter (DMT)-like permease